MIKQFFRDYCCVSCHLHMRDGQLCSVAKYRFSAIVVVVVSVPAGSAALTGNSICIAVPHPLLSCSCHFSFHITTSLPLLRLRCPHFFSLVCSHTHTHDQRAIATIPLDTSHSIRPVLTRRPGKQLESKRLSVSIDIHRCSGL